LKKLILKVPGSTSNLGPGFDTFSLALSLYTRLTFTFAEQEDADTPFITFKGPISQSSQPADMDALIDRIIRKLWADDPQLVQRTRISVDSQIPLGAGLGSSDAAIIGTLYAAYAFRDLVPMPADLLGEAAVLEGHGESMAASLLGGFVICTRTAGSRRLIARQHVWPDHWKTILVIPPYTAKTADARAVLPQFVPFDDAVANMQRTALFMSALTNGHDAALKEALNDRLHEPYRHAIAPMFPEVRALLQDQPILGVVLSGAGPSILVIVNEKHQITVLEKLRSWAASIIEKPIVLPISVDSEGLKELGQPGRPRNS
jgi:homoserine kinase